MTRHLVAFSHANYLQALLPLLEALPDPAFLLDADDQIVGGNARAEHLLPPPAGANGTARSFLERFPPRQRHAVAIALRGPRADDTLPLDFLEIPARRPGAPPDLVSILVGDLAEQGGPAGWRLVCLRDGAPAASLRARLAAAERDLAGLADRLRDEVRERTYDLYQAHFDAIYSLALVCEARDPGIGRHLRRIQHTSEAIALEAGLEPADAVEIGYSAVLHDVGKLVVPDRILRKPDPLSDPERRVMRQHTTAGERILGERPFFATARRIARAHHEAWSGGGYPDGLAGDRIPVAARVVAIADMYDALVSERVYKGAWEPERAAAQIAALAGVRFEPVLVRAFLRLFDRGEIAELFEHVDQLHSRELPALLE